MAKKPIQVDFKDIADRAIHKYLDIYASANDMPRFIKSTNRTGGNTAFATPNGTIEISYEDLHRMNAGLLKINPNISNGILKLLKQEYEQNPDNQIIKQKLDAVQDIFNKYGKYIENPQLLYSTEREQQYFMEAAVAHEMGHVFFKNKNTPHTYNNEINALNLWSADENGIGRRASPTVGRMNNEIRADALAIKAMQQHYGNNNPDFNSFLEKYTAFRMITSIPAIYGRYSEYNMYHLYKNDREAIDKMPPFNKENLTKIESQIEAITLKNLQEFGITTKEQNRSIFGGISSLFSDKNEWLEDGIEENQKLTKKYCDQISNENPTEALNLFGGKNIKEANSICVSSAHHQETANINSKKIAEVIQNSEIFPKISILTEDNKVVQNGMQAKNNTDFNIDDVINRVSNENKKFEKEEVSQKVLNGFQYK